HYEIIMEECYYRIEFNGLQKAYNRRVTKTVIKVRSLAIVVTQIIYVRQMGGLNS
ncbi:14701_t:CDS:1, partial [Funneliformis mosseae]